MAEHPEAVSAVSADGAAGSAGLQADAAALAAVRDVRAAVRALCALLPQGPPAPGVVHTLVRKPCPCPPAPRAAQENGITSWHERSERWNGRGT
ncbi:hypothetical protein [Streptomyces sp. NPDC060205]|uniref:hypothetical protein n=1 Tax=Streptomyces sp. NPDC060205 TaxID=3347072 RepID=UPI00365870F2